MLSTIKIYQDMTMNLQKHLISLLLISAPFMAHSATYYKSVDENGNVQYTQTKPKQIETERIKVNAHAPDNSSTYKRPTLKADNKEADTKSEEAKEPEKKLTKEQKQKGCASARSNLATLNSKGQIRQRNEKGEVSYLPDEKKQARIKQTQDLINKHCK
jgi:Domain of unknown function (DUF4124)